MTFLDTLLAAPPSTPLSRYTIGNGALYLGLGALLLVWPGAVQIAFFADDFVGREAGLVRVLGMTVMVIGWFYVAGGRTAADSFGLATVVDRLLIPAILVPLALSGAVDWHLAVPFAVLDPVLGIGGFVVWRRSRASA